MRRRLFEIKSKHVAMHEIFEQNTRHTEMDSTQKRLDTRN